MADYPTLASRYIERPGAVAMLADTDETPAEEAAEPAVVAEPKINRSAFLYLEPRPGKDGEGQFGQCASCTNFIPESFFNGSLVGDRCSIFGTGFSVDDDSSCNLFVPWASGTPCDDLVMFNAGELRAGCPSSVDPWQAGYLHDCRTQCGTCRHFEGESGECGAFEELNTKAPGLFMLDTKVKPRGECSLWTPQPPPEPMEGY